MLYSPLSPKSIARLNRGWTYRGTIHSLAVHVEGKQSRTSFIDFTLLHSSSSSSSSATSFFFSLPPCRQGLLPLPNAAFSEPLLLTAPQ